MIRLLLTLMALTAAYTLRADDNLQKVLTLIEQNNTTLKALRTGCDAEKIGNRTGLNLADPEIGFGYMWNNTPGDPNKKNVSVSQNFDYATISGIKNKMADNKNELVEWQYRTERMNIMLEAKKYALDVIYYNAMLSQLNVRRQHNHEITEAQKKLLDNGSGNKLEYNNARLNLIKTEGEIKRTATERDAALSELVRLNGGISVDLPDSVFVPVPMPANYEQWYAEAEKKNPVLAYVKQEIEVSRKQVTLSRSAAFPSITAGYSGEFGGGDRTQGFTVGISIPLWSNKNRVRQAKTALRAAEERHSDVRLQYYSNIRTMFIRTRGLKDAADTYRMSLSETDNSSLLKKALNEGHISVLDYFVEIGIYYEAVDKAIEAEREYQKAYAELTAVEL